MKVKIIGIVRVLLCTSLLASPCMAAVEMQVLKTLKLASPPVDMAMSADGKWVFTLTKEGTVEVYTLDGKLTETLNVGPGIDQIEAGPREDIIVVKSTLDQTVQVLTIEFVQSIDITGSPFKGPEDAPVVVVVFSDFQ
jgi:hypothetical protein